MATNPKKSTSAPVSKKASAVLKSSSTGKASKSAAGSALSQVNPKNVSSKKAATAASKTLSDGRTGAASKSAAGSVLSQAGSRKIDPGSGTNSGGPRKKK